MAEKAAEDGEMRGIGGVGDQVGVGVGFCVTAAVESAAAGVDSLESTLRV